MHATTSDKPSSPDSASFGRSFWQGLTRPSLAGAVGMLAGAAAWFIACLLLVTPHNLTKIDGGYLMTVEEDHYTEVSLRAMRLREQGHQPFAIAMLGTSAMRDSVRDEQFVEHAVAEATGEPAPVYFLAAKAMNLVEMACVMDYVSEGFDGIIVMYVGPFGVSMQPRNIVEFNVDNPRLAIATPVYDEELQLATGRTPARTGNYFLDHWKFFSQRLNANAVEYLLFGPQRPPRYPYVGKPPADEQGRKDQLALARKWIAPHYQLRDKNIKIVERMIERLRAGGHVEFVLVEMPRNKPFWNEVPGPQLLADYDQWLRQWVAKINEGHTTERVHYWQLDDEAGLKPDDFFDFVHLRKPEAQRRYTRVLADHLKKLAVEWHKAQQEHQP